MFPQSKEMTVTQNTADNSGGTKTYLFDFDKGDVVVLDGKLIECDGIEAIKVWIEKIIRTQMSAVLISQEIKVQSQLHWRCI